MIICIFATIGLIGVGIIGVTGGEHREKPNGGEEDTPAPNNDVHAMQTSRHAAGVEVVTPLLEARVLFDADRVARTVHCSTAYWLSLSLDDKKFLTRAVGAYFMTDGDFDTAQILSGDSDEIVGDNTMLSGAKIYK